jgi:hypothetical protein
MAILYHNKYYLSSVCNYLHGYILHAGIRRVSHRYWILELLIKKLRPSFPADQDNDAMMRHTGCQHQKIVSVATYDYMIVVRCIPHYLGIPCGGM